MTAGKVEQRSESPARGALILIVEDEQLVRDGLADYLTMQGYRVHAVASAESAITWLQGTRPDLILSDVMLPGMDGFLFYQTLRANPGWVNLPFIFLTALDSAEHLIKGNSLGVDQYITKPFDFASLAAAIEGQILRHRTLESVLRADVEAMKRQLLTVFSHELRTPLTYIYGYLSLMDDLVLNPDPESLRMMIHGIGRGAARLLNLVEELTLIVRIDAGVVANEIRQSHRPVALQEVLDLALSKLQPLMEESAVRVEMNLPHFLTLDGEPVYLQEIFLRVIENGIKFCRRESGLVRVEAQQIGQMLRVSVTDNGIGMDTSAIAGIFERFKQVDRDLMEQQGLGLGLSIVHDLVTLHGGMVNLTSTPGVGTVVEIDLPSATE